MLKPRRFRYSLQIQLRLKFVGYAAAETVASDVQPPELRQPTKLTGDLPGQPVVAEVELFHVFKFGQSCGYLAGKTVLPQVKVAQVG